MLFLALGGRSSGLGGLGLRQALLEFINTTGGINELLGPGIERVAGVANTDQDGGLGRAGLNHVAASATDFRFLIFGMCFSFHITKAENDTSNRGFDKSYFAEF
jgi:hypothetical protein